MSLRIVPSFEPLMDSFKKKGFSLLPHQKKAVRWMFSRETTSKSTKGGILADEMGVGKTIETIGLMMYHKVQYTLIIVPASLITQWKSEIEKFTSDITIHIHKLDETNINVGLNIVITSFVKSTRDHIMDHQWGRIVIDEAHTIRNPKGKLFKKICNLKSDFKWCLTGTPIQNYKSDVKTLLKFVGVKKGDLKKNIQTYLLRRTKEEVNIKLGGYKYVEHVTTFKSLYEKQLYKEVENNTHPSVEFSFLETLLRRRQAAILPQLVLDGYGKKQKAKASKWKYNNTKISEIVKQLEENPDEKPVVFCYFRREMQFLEKKLDEKEITYNTIHGGVGLDDRKTMIDNSEEYRVLIIQIMAGSTGLNLQSFNSVYFSGPHWNPTHEQQAIARVYRMGQTQAVTVRRFILKDTIEELILQIQKNKLELIQKYL
jgi:SNF2 family DNA or RNA helicase